MNVNTLFFLLVSCLSSRLLCLGFWLQTFLIILLDFLQKSKFLLHYSLIKTTMRKKTIEYPNPSFVYHFLALVYHELMSALLFAYQYRHFGVQCLDMSCLKWLVISFASSLILSIFLTTYFLRFFYSNNLLAHFL